MNAIKFFRKKLDKKGFTLVELLLVIALLAVIGGVFVPRLFGTLDNAKADADLASARNLAHQAELLIATGGLGGTLEADGITVLTETHLKLTALPTCQAGTANTFRIVYNSNTKKITAGYAGTGDEVVTDINGTAVTIDLTELDL